MRASKIVKLVFIAIGSLTSALLAILVFCYWYMSVGVFNSDSFEKSKWHAAISDENSGTCYRGGMAKDIKDNLLSTKMTKHNIVALLGEPEANFTENEYQYDLGMCSGLAFDYDYLHVYFDEKEYFSHAEIIQH